MLALPSHKPATWLLLVFLTALGVRIYWIHEKEMIYGDELTSVCLSYNAPGWGEQTFDSRRIYTGDELRKLFYTDDRGGIEGLWHDLAGLHQDNRDPSHASLYYMLLRCALTGVKTPSAVSVMRHGCGLNLLLFALSFLGLYKWLNTIFPQRPMLVCTALLLAFLNPAAISNTLLLREYQLAECLFTGWVWWCTRMALDVQGRQPAYSLRNLGLGVLIAAGLSSSGYFNLIFIGLTGISLIVISFRHAHSATRPLAFYLAGTAGCIGACLTMYEGFFNLLYDVRTTEVADKLQGNDWVANLSTTFLQGGYMLFIRILNPIVCLTAIIGILAFLQKKNRPCHRPHLPVPWLFASACIWAAVALTLAPWKATRYVSPALPVLMSAFAFYYSLLLNTFPRKVQLFIIGPSLLSYCLWAYPIEHLERTHRPWPAEASRVLLYGPDDEEKNTINLLVPYLKDHQECVIVESVADIASYVPATDSLIYIYGSRAVQELIRLPGFRKEEVFNDWMNAYIYASGPWTAEKEPTGEDDKKKE